MNAEQMTTDALVALALMVEQYCTWKDEQIGDCYFHTFLSANETAFETLERAGLLREVEREMYVFTELWTQGNYRWRVSV